MCETGPVAAEVTRRIFWRGRTTVRLVTSAATIFSLKCFHIEFLNYLRCLEAPGHIQLQDVIISNRVQDRQIRIVAARSEIFIDSLRVTITERADNVVGETVSQSGINALKIAAAFHEI